MSLESYLAPSGVPMHDVRVQLAFEPLVRVELAAAVELVLQVAEHLLGRGVVQTVALAAHGLADAEASELVPPPLVLVLPSHVAVQDRLRARGRRSASMAGRRFCCPRSGLRLTSQATISLLAMSYTGARYALPPATLNSVTSVPSLEKDGLATVCWTGS